MQSRQEGRLWKCEARSLRSWPDGDGTSTTMRSSCDNAVSYDNAVVLMDAGPDRHGRGSSCIWYAPARFKTGTDYVHTHALACQRALLRVAHSIHWVHGTVLSCLLAFPHALSPVNSLLFLQSGAEGFCGLVWQRPQRCSGWSGRVSACLICLMPITN